MSTPVSTITLPHWIGGHADASPAQRHTEITESATGQVVAQVPLASAALGAPRVD